MSWSFCTDSLSSDSNRTREQRRIRILTRKSFCRLLFCISNAFYCCLELCWLKENDEMSSWIVKTSLIVFSRLRLRSIRSMLLDPLLDFIKRSLLSHLLFFILEVCSPCLKDSFLLLQLKLVQCCMDTMSLVRFTVLDLRNIETPQCQNG